MKTLQEISGPVEVVHAMLEADLQGVCVDWMRRRGWWARKFSSISQRSVPDYLFASGPYRRTGNNRISALKFYCEFKKPGTKPKLIEKHNVRVMSTEQQYEEQLAMKAAGWQGFECDDYEQFKAWVIAFEEGRPC